MSLPHGALGLSVIIEFPGLAQFFYISCESSAARLTICTKIKNRVPTEIQKHNSMIFP